MANSFLWRFAPGSPIPRNLPGLKEVEGGWLEMRLNAQSYFYILVQTGIAKQRDVNLQKVRTWFDQGCPGAPHAGDPEPDETEAPADAYAEAGADAEVESYL